MHDEQIVWAQENVESKTPESWRDISVPKIHTGIPPKQRNVTVEEWAKILTSHKMVGVYRAYTARQRIVAIIVTEAKVYNWRVKDITQ